MSLLYNPFNKFIGLYKSITIHEITKKKKELRRVKTHLKITSKLVADIQMIHGTKINSSYSFFPLKDMQTGLRIMQSSLIYDIGSRHANFVKHKVKFEVQC